jgi:hypothetical protein
MTFGTVSQIIESSLLCRGWAWQKVTLYVDDRWRPKLGGVHEDAQEQL